MKDEDYYASMLAKSVGQNNENGMHVSLTATELATIVGIHEEELFKFVNFMHIMTRNSVATSVLSGDVDPETSDYEEAIVSTSALTALLVARAMFKEQEHKRIEDEHSKYPVTLMAEAHVRNYSSSGDLDAIWPTEVVKEVLEEFSPEEAFLVGVVCGKSHG